MRQILEQIEKWPLAGKFFFRIYSFFLILSGILYVIVQFYIANSIQDSLFIGLLLGGSFILLLGIKWIHRFFLDKTVDFITSLGRVENRRAYNSINDAIIHEQPNKNDDQLMIAPAAELLKKIFKNPLSPVAAIIYGLAVGSVPYLLDIWPQYQTLKLLLALFLFIVNFLTGSAFYALVMLFVFLYRTSGCIYVGLYDRYHPATVFITELSKRASIVASFYITFSITSIYFSELPVNSLTVGYSVFAAIVIVFVYIVPMIPIRNKIQMLKKQTVNDLSVQIQQELDLLMSLARTGGEVDTGRFNALMELRTKISGLQSIPIGFKVVWNAIYIVLITLLPVFIQVFLEKVID